MLKYYVMLTRLITTHLYFLGDHSIMDSQHIPEGGRPLGEAWLRVGAIIAEFDMGCYGVAR